jgi:hypothetical protein
MKNAITLAAIALAVTIWTAPAAFADSDKDKSGPGWERPYHGSEYKQKSRQGDCKVERKWEKDGKYKEKIKCKDDDDD